MHGYMDTWIFTAALFPIAKSYKKNKCSINTCGIYKVDYYFAMKRNEVLIDDTV